MKKARKSKWEDRVPEIRRLAGTMPVQDLAKIMGTTSGNLSFIGSKYGISMRYDGPRPPKPVKSDGARLNNEEKAAAAAAKEAHISALAGTMPKEDLAEQLGMSTDQLKSFCSKRGISLRRGSKQQPTPVMKPAVSLKTQDELEAAANELRKYGYTVLCPDPFRTYIDCRSRPQAQV